MGTSWDELQAPSFSGEGTAPMTGLLVRGILDGQHSKPLTVMFEFTNVPTDRYSTKREENGTDKFDPAIWRPRTDVVRCDPRD